MEKKIIAPAAINALIEALANIYWYKKELRIFLTHTISNSSILAKLNWQDYKRNIISTLLRWLIFLLMIRILIKMIYWD